MIDNGFASEVIRWGLVWLGLSVLAALLFVALLGRGRVRDAMVPPCGCEDDCERSGR